MNWETQPSRWGKEKRERNFIQALLLIALPILFLIGLILTT